MLVTVQQVKDYLGIDYEDEQVVNNIERLIKVADKMLTGALGRSYPENDERVQECALIIIEDLYSQRGINDKIAHNTRILFNDLMMQVRLEMRDNDDF